ncbi:MAG: citrate lyase acyl carrier protein [Candidatus Cloacimonetes bacterium]|nr:citrate lyase acyl carrier protein [Candidatus Cloacimonadota bacterium]MBL7149089.1 citrate lyase acyl carrier protein [Candidatus Cloacimonadota bacterium]
MSNKTVAGNRGDDIRSDCYVELELTKNNGIQIDLQSKVKTLFGDSIIELCKKELKFFGIKNCIIKIEDTGALDYVLVARIEAAIKQLIDTDKEYLLDLLPQNKYKTKKDRYRRSRLYLPGNTPKLALNAGIHKPDGVILDLEDSVAHSKKFEATILVRNTLRSVDFYGAERMVRINQIPKGLDDLKYIVPHNVNLILVPKCESAEQIKLVNGKIDKILNKHNLSYNIFLMPIIESALGIIKAYEIATVAENVVALAIGLEDYTADLGTQRTKEGKETFLARCQIVNAAKAAGIQAIDSVFSDVSDMEALKQNVLESKSLGFDGMGCIHPRQIKVIHEYFAPNDEEIERAKKIVNAFHIATEKGLGVVSLGSKMIDPPVVKRAQRTIEQAIDAGKLKKNWRNDYVS